MSQQDTPRVKAHEVREGDRVFMRINLHGSADEIPGVSYERAIYASGVVGEVVEAPHDRDYAMLEAGEPIMADFTVKDDDGNTFTWNVDNGYVHGYRPDMGRSTDIGKFGGFYDPDAL